MSHGFGMQAVNGTLVDTTKQILPLNLREPAPGLQVSVATIRFLIRYRMLPFSPTRRRPSLRVLSPRSHPTLGLTSKPPRPCERVSEPETETPEKGGGRGRVRAAGRALATRSHRRDIDARSAPHDGHNPPPPLPPPENPPSPTPCHKAAVENSLMMRVGVGLRAVTGNSVARKRRKRSGYGNGADHYQGTPALHRETAGKFIMRARYVFSAREITSRSGLATLETIATPARSTDARDP
ncbi:hypothetical protein ALC62_00941 [Cyphomyrmex costatus]|uniref:Uncharacterized protein n=1 Tax=Cyphomyrmex costatus TaxID=456900 RepID=A0A195D5G6_9HYME|nr:hypothetical protein ALC62_00941 [Cyphomyrmex costatus]